MPRSDIHATSRRRPAPWATVVAAALTVGSAGLASSPAAADAGRSNLSYVSSATILVHAVQVRRDGSRPFEEYPVSPPREIQLVPATHDVAALLVDIGLPPGVYDDVRLEATSGAVVLSDRAHVAHGHTFSTSLGTLHLPSAGQSGIKVGIDPPIHVVTRLSPELTLVLDLEHTFVLNGPPTHDPGVKRVVLTPVTPAANTSTHGRITLRAVQENQTSQCAGPNTPLAGMLVAAIDRTRIAPPVTTVTDAAGEAWLPLLPGVYDVVLTAPGYETVRIEGQTVRVANETSLGDVIMVRPVTTVAFDQDRAILLMIMANIAYADGTGRDGDLSTTAVGDPLPRTGEPYVDRLDTRLADYLDPCWRLVDYLDVDEGVSRTQFFIARHVRRGDLVVSFRGTSESEDWLTDAYALKKDWVLRDGAVVENSVHAGIHDAYLHAAGPLQSALDEAIATYAPNTSRARVYFTGHSLGGGLATLAALDMADYLVATHGYARDNMIMYSYGAPRTITERLAPVLTREVPNSFGVAAKDDLVTHVPDGENGPLFDNEFTQIENLIVLSSNIPNVEDDGDGRYQDLRETRIERSAGRLYEGCVVVGGRGVPGAAYGTTGHERVQYIKRLENIVDAGIPAVWLDLDDHGDLVMNWQGGVQGPCDWVGLYATDATDPPTPPVDANDYLGLPVDGSEWVVDGTGYPYAVSSDGTGKDPSGPFDATKDFWIGYVDGFDRLIRTVRYTGPRDAPAAGNARAGTAPTLAAASPNPAVAFTTLRFTLPRPAQVRATVCDVAGRLVRELLRGAREPGDHAVPWDLRDARGHPVAPGVYFVRFEAEEQKIVRPVLVPW